MCVCVGKVLEMASIHYQNRGTHPLLHSSGVAVSFKLFPSREGIFNFYLKVCVASPASNLFAAHAKILNQPPGPMRRAVQPPCSCHPERSRGVSLLLEDALINLCLKSIVTRKPLLIFRFICRILNPRRSIANYLLISVRILTFFNYQNRSLP